MQYCKVERLTTREISNQPGPLRSIDILPLVFIITTAYRAGKSPRKAWCEMSLFKRTSLYVVALLVLLISSLASAGEGKNPGHDQSPGLGLQIQSYSGSIISPDGSGLPSGNGTVSAGKVLYATQCAACHGIDGRQPGNQLAGGIGSLSSQRPLKTVGSFWPYATTLYDYIARAMPYNQEKSLSVNEVYAITAYVLNLNDVLGDDAVVDENSLPVIIMPNQKGFIELVR